MGFLKTFEEYKDFTDFSSDFLTKFKDNCPEAVKLTHRKYGEGSISEMLPILNKDIDIKTTITFSTETKIFYLCVLVRNNLLVGASEQLIMLLNEYSKICTKFYEAQRAAEVAERQRLAEEKEAKEAAEKQAKKEQQITDRFNKEYEKLSSIKSVQYKETPALTSFYYSLGWLATNGRNVSAAMPDFMEPWFTSTFGDVKRSVVDSKKRTIGGFPMQWTLSMKLAVKNIDKMPTFLEEYLSADKKFIANTEFIYTLVKDYGFEFGVKSQNFEKIKSTVPQEYIKFFERGAGINLSI